MNFYPAKLQIGDELFKPVKIIDGGSSAYVYGLVDHKPALLFEITDANIVSTGPRSYQITGDRDGNAITAFAERDKGCGCGNPLKRFNPQPNRSGT